MIVNEQIHCWSLFDVGVCFDDHTQLNKTNSNKYVNHLLPIFFNSRLHSDFFALTFCFCPDVSKSINKLLTFYIIFVFISVVLLQMYLKLSILKTGLFTCILKHYA